MSFLIEHNVPSRKLTSLGAGGDIFTHVKISHPNDFKELHFLSKKDNIRLFALGNGTNLLLPDENSSYFLISTAISMPCTFEKNKHQYLVTVACSLPLPVFLAELASKGLKGFEGLAGIPGTVGGAIAMNAGSYGVEIGTKLAQIELWSLKNGLEIIKAKDFRTAYRSFEFDGSDDFWLAFQASFLFTEIDTKENIKKNMQHYKSLKQATQPVKARSAGCIFKNPPQQTAGKLLDEAGMKNISRGNFTFSDLHANFLVNTAKENEISVAADALELIALAKEKVFNKFNINLETEVCIL